MRNREDGKEQPYGRAGEAIPLAARMVNLSAVVEIADRLTGRGSATAVVAERAGKSFDPRVASAGGYAPD
ncbi:MAG: hypothetical protein AB7I38_03175 [Dehalococcoidia bacterium]